MIQNIINSKDEKVEIDITSIYKGHNNLTYRGVALQKCPFDYLIYQIIIFDYQPDLIIEVGTNFGGTALYLADLLNIIGGGIVHSIDVKDKCENVVKSHPRIKLFTEGWENYDLCLTSQFKKILVIEDSSHTYENTFGVMEKFSDVVSIGSYLIVEDGIVNALGMKRAFNGGPLKAINKFLKLRDDFSVDRKWCDLFGKNATFNVKGYLKKIR